MFHLQLIVLIIGIFLCSIHGDLLLDGFRANEKLVECGWEHEANGTNRESSGNWVCTGQSVCAHEWFVRSDEHRCVPVWQCPDVCPPRSQFRSCTNSIGRFTSLKAATFIEQCGSVCVCEEGCSMDRNKTKCLC